MISTCIHSIYLFIYIYIIYIYIYNLYIYILFICVVFSFLQISQLRGLGHGGKEGGPQRAALVADLAATHRVAAGAREARTRVLTSADDWAVTGKSCLFFIAIDVK